MSELKAYTIYEGDVGNYTEHVVYSKSEADEVIAHNKYKRCLAMARMCEERSARYDALQEGHDLDWRREIEFYYKWYMRWLELADKFKETK